MRFRVEAFGVDPRSVDTDRISLMVKSVSRSIGADPEVGFDDAGRFDVLSQSFGLEDQNIRPRPQREDKGWREP